MKSMRFAAVIMGLTFFHAWDKWFHFEKPGKFASKSDRITSKSLHDDQTLKE